MDTAKLEAQQKLLDKFNEDIAAPIHVCDFGSCQYTSVQATFEFALAFLKLDRAAFEERFEIAYTGAYTEAEFIEVLRDVIRGEGKGDNIRDDIQEVGDYYEWCRDQAYDLWSASIPPLRDFQMGEFKLVGFQKTGFLINDLITENESFITGVELAYTTYLFGTEESNYYDFST